MRTYISLLAALALLGACTSQELVPDRRPDYRTSQTGNSLAVPPDLTSSTIDDALVVPELSPEATASLSDYAGERAAAVPAGASGVDAGPSVLTPVEGIGVRREGDRRWLVVAQSPERLWPEIKDFWLDSGLPLERDDPRVGIMETAWLENRNDIPDGPIRNVLRKYLDFAYSVPTRDKFRVRLEPADGRTAVYLTHYGVEEVAQGRPNQETGFVWQSRPRDPELEAEMINRLMVHLGAEQRRADAALAAAGDSDPGDTSAAPAPARPRAEIVDTSDGYRALVIGEGYDRAWRLVGLSLDGGNYVIEQQDRDRGLYLIGRPPVERQADSGGLLSSLAFWRDDEPGQLAEAGVDDGTRYRVRLAGRGEQTLVVVQNDQGGPDNSETAGRILEAVRETVQ